MTKKRTIHPTVWDAVDYDSNVGNVNDGIEYTKLSPTEKMMYNARYLMQLAYNAKNDPQGFLMESWSYAEDLRESIAASLVTIANEIDPEEE